MAHASGKVILCGEHAAVYGRPALACGIERGVFARATPADAFSLWVDGNRLDEGAETFAAFQALCDQLGGAARRVDVQLEMPVGVGLGASAAMAVAIARALLESSRGEPDDSKVNGVSSTRDASAEARILAAADAWERLFHGNPSGIDAATAYAGGCLRFQRGSALHRIELPRSFDLAIAVAGPPSATKEMVDRVAAISERDPARFARELDALTILVEQAERRLLALDWPELGALLDENQSVLTGWSLSTPEIEDCRRLAREAGAWGAKLTGAGGGGCVIALPGELGSAPVLAAWNRAGYPCFSSRVAAAR